MDNDLNKISFCGLVYLQPSSVYHGSNYIFVNRFCDLTQNHQ